MSQPHEKQDEFSQELESIKNMTGFALRSFKRRWRLIAGCVALAALAGAMAIRLLPEEYHVGTRLLTDPGYVMVGLTRPDRRIPTRALDGTRGAVELIRSRAGLEAVITDAKLVETWREHRPPIRVVIDEIREFVIGPMSEQELREGILELLETRLWASVEDGVVNIMARWHDPLIATRIAHAAQQRFVTSQQQRELTEIQETIGILEEAIEEARPALEVSAEEMKVLARKHRARIIRRPSMLPPITTDPTLARLEMKRTELRAAEQGYMEMVHESRTRLSRLTSQLGPLHPDVLTARRTLENLSEPPPQIAELQAEVESFESRVSSAYASRRASDVEVVPAAGGIDPELERAVQTYRYHEGSFRDLLDRLADARMELETAQSGFAHRYIITQPAVPPRQPTGPGGAVVLLAALVGGLLLGLGLAVLWDLRSGRLMESWQVPEELGVPLLAEIKDP